MTIQYIVYSNRFAYEARKKIFERCNDLPRFVAYPFNGIIDIFKFLFGQDAVLTFNIF